MNNTPKPWLWKPGAPSPNPGGRPRNRVKIALDEAKKDPVGELLALMPELKPRDQANVWLELLSYLQGKPKEVEPSFTTEELAEMLEARLGPKEKAG